MLLIGTYINKNNVLIRVPIILLMAHVELSHTVLKYITIIKLSEAIKNTILPSNVPLFYFSHYSTGRTFESSTKRLRILNANAHYCKLHYRNYYTIHQFITYSKKKFVNSEYSFKIK